MDGGTTCARLRAGDLAPVAGLLASALHDDPAYAYLFPAPDARRDGLEAFFTAHLGNHVPHGCTWVTTGDDGSTAATVTVRPPGGIPIPVRALVWGLLRLSARHGTGAGRRLLRLRDAYEDLERRTAGTDRYWHVHMMAVRPALQGRGLGSGLLGEVLEGVDDATPVALTTHQERNVVFYRRAGFEVTLDETLSLPGAAPYRVWGMRRDPR